MGVKFKTKSKAPEVQIDTSVPVEADGLIGVDADLAELIDRLGEVNTQLKKLQAEVKPVADASAMLESAIRGHIEAMGIPAEESATLQGQSYTAVVGKKANKSEIKDKEKLVETLELIQPGLYVELSKVNLTDLNKYLTGKQLEEVLETKAVGSRKLTVTKKFNG